MSASTISPILENLRLHLNSMNLPKRSCPNQKIRWDLTPHNIRSDRIFCKLYPNRLDLEKYQ